jgi:hypothetical protein
VKAKLFYDTQRLAIEISGRAQYSEFDGLEFAPGQREFLLEENRQVYNLEVSIPVAEGTSLPEYLRKLSIRICDDVRALRTSRRGSYREVTELERIYAEIEGEDCQSAVSVQVEPIHVVLDIEQDLELLRDILKMYREISSDQQYERWQEQFERIFEVLRDLNAFR